MDSDAVVADLFKNIRFYTIGDLSEQVGGLANLACAAPILWYGYMTIYQSQIYLL